MTRTQPGQKYFQLTHDYLVHSLRDWLTRKQKETRRGRAELKLFDTSITWNSKPENRLLPSWWEALEHSLAHRQEEMDPAPAEDDEHTGRVHGFRFAMVLMGLVILVSIGAAVQRKWPSSGSQPGSKASSAAWSVPNRTRSPTSSNNSTRIPRWPRPSCRRSSRGPPRRLTKSGATACTARDGLA